MRVQTGSKGQPYLGMYVCMRVRAGVYMTVWVAECARAP